MEEKDAKEYKISRIAVVDEDNIYKVAKSWAEDHEIKIHETEHKSKGSMVWKWEADKDHSNYFKSKYEIEVMIDNPVPVDIIEGDKKVKKTRAKVVIKIKSKMILDREKRWESSDFLKKIEKFYNKYLFKDPMTKFKKEVEAWTKELYENYKKAVGAVE